MLVKTSRYADANSTDIMLLRTDKTQVRTVYRVPRFTGTSRVTNYIWRRGDRIDAIAADFLGDPKRFWEILDINPEITNGAQIEPGTVVRIPNG